MKNEVITSLVVSAAISLACFSGISPEVAYRRLTQGTELVQLVDSDDDFTAKTGFKILNPDIMPGADEMSK